MPAFTWLFTFDPDDIQHQQPPPQCRRPRPRRLRADAWLRAAGLGRDAQRRQGRMAFVAARAGSAVQLRRKGRGGRSSGSRTRRCLGGDAPSATNQILTPGRYAVKNCSMLVHEGRVSHWNPALFAASPAMLRYNNLTVIDLSERILQSPPSCASHPAKGSAPAPLLRRTLQVLCGVVLVALPLTNGLRLGRAGGSCFTSLWHRMAAHDLVLLFWAAMLGVWTAGQRFPSCTGASGAAPCARKRCCRTSP